MKDGLNIIEREWYQGLGRLVRMRPWLGAGAVVVQISGTSGAHNNVLVDVRGHIVDRVRMCPGKGCCIPRLVSVIIWKMLVSEMP